MTATLYAAKAAVATTSDLYTLNSTTAAPSSIGASGHALTALAFRPSDGVLFAASSPQSTAHPSHLLTIDPLTGAATDIGALGMTIGDIAFNSSSVLYGWAPSSEVAVTINTTTGAATSLGGAAVTSFGGALGFHSDGTLYLLLKVSGSLNLYTINTGSGLVSLVGGLSPPSNNIPAAGSFDGSDLFWFLNGGGGGSGISLQTLNVGTTARATIGAPGANFDGLAWSLAGDTTPPSLLSVSARSATVTLTYNEPLGGTPLTSEFAVTRNGSAVTVTAAEIAGSTVVLTLASPVHPGETVLVSYTA